MVIGYQRFKISQNYYMFDLIWRCLVELRCAIEIFTKTTL